MTLAAVKKLAFQLPPLDRLKLVKALQNEVAPMRKPVTLSQLERRADQVQAEMAEVISSKEFFAGLKKFLR